MDQFDFIEKTGSDLMRIERINENSIRCTLTSFDLSIRNVKLAELTYGSEKARTLFREMMQQASHEVGFEAEDTPIMVEAIPMANDSIMLIITKIDDPEELDTRFSRFSPADDDGDSSWGGMPTELLEGADGILNLLGNPEVLEKLPVAAPSERTPSQSTAPLMAQSETVPQNTRIYQFDTLDLVCAAAKEISHIFTGESILYKNPVNEKFYLLLKKETCDELAFSKTCNKLSEYAVRQKYEPATEAYYAEHYEIFVKKNALQALAQL